METRVHRVANEPWHAMDAAEVIERLGTDPKTGLSRGEAAARIEEYGPNEVSKEKGRHFLSMLLEQFINPLVIVLLGAAFVTFLLGHYVDTIVILAVVIINAVIGLIQEGKAASAIEALSKLLTVESTLIRDGETARLPSLELVPGDIVTLQGGDKVPADIRLINEKNLQADESILTGESAPVSKSSGPVSHDDPISDRACIVYSGTLVTRGVAKGVVIATGDSTQLGLISGLITEAPVIVTPLTRKLAKFGKWLSAAVLGVAALTFLLGLLVGREVVEMFFAAVAVAVAMIPEGLPAIVTIVLSVGVKRMADRNAIIRSLPSVETLGSVTVICSDKTGTLTANEMTVSRVFAGHENYEFGGIGYDPTKCYVAPVDTDTTELESGAFIETLRCGLLCNDSELFHEDDRWYPGGDPTEVALIVSAMKVGLKPREERESYSRVDVIPFESTTMYMATLNATPEAELVIYAKGSTERILDMCNRQLFRDGEGELDKQLIVDRAEALAAQGYRILAFAGRRVSEETDEISPDDLHDLVFLGLQAMSDPARPEVIGAIRECKEAGIEVKMITGDHITTAIAIARELEIGEHNVVAITGSELTKLSDDEYEKVVNDTQVFARVAPEQKYRLVEALQAQGQIVAMTGDGVNDAPALKRADIGVAMGEAGSDVAKDASDMVLTDDNFASIVAAVEEGRTVFGNLIKTLAYILPTNAGEGLVIIVAMLGGFVLPVTPVQVLWINTVTAVTLALPLAFEPMEPGVMKSPPRRPNAPMLSRLIIFRIALVGIVMVIGAFGLFAYVRSIGVPVEQARTMAVGAIVAYEIFYLFAARSLFVPTWRMGLWNNPYIWVGVFFVILLQMGFTYIPTMNFLFGSAPLTLGNWLSILLVSFPILIILSIEEWIRLVLMKNRPSSRPAG